MAAKAVVAAQKKRAGKEWSKSKDDRAFKAASMRTWCNDGRWQAAGMGGRLFHRAGRATTHTAATKQHASLASSGLTGMAPRHGAALLSARGGDMDLGRQPAYL